jgi:hypothetical protein
MNTGYEQKPPEVSNGETVVVINIILGKSSQLMKSSSLSPEKTRQVHSNCFFNIHTVVHYKFHPQVKILNKYYYTDILWQQQKMCGKNRMEVQFWELVSPLQQCC